VVACLAGGVPKVHVFDTLQCALIIRRVRPKTAYSPLRAHGVKRIGYQPLYTDKLLFPIHVRGNHWVLVTVEMPHHRVTLFDSLEEHAHDDDAYTPTALMGNVLSFVLAAAKLPGLGHADQRAEYLGHLPPAEEWTTQTARVPQQPNSNDCGVYTIAFLLCQASCDVVDRFTFVPDDIPRLRLALAHWLLKGRTRLRPDHLCSSSSWWL
jgi:Ulp1 family protease